MNNPILQHHNPYICLGIAGQMVAAALLKPFLANTATDGSLAYYG